MIDATVYDGKYRYIFNHDGAKALRYGEERRDLTGDGFIIDHWHQSPGMRMQGHFKTCQADRTEATEPEGSQK